MAEPEEEPPKLPPRMKTRKRENDFVRDIIQFYTREENFSLQQFYDEFFDKLPVFAMVTQGCLGLSNITTYSVEQTMFCKAFVDQKRVIARDAKARILSIPLDYPLKFRVVHSRKEVGKRQLLSELVEENKFPVQVQFSVPGDVTLSISEDKRRVKELTNLVLVDYTYETFLIAHGVYGKYVVPEPMVVPMYLDDMLLSTVCGAEKVSDEGWKPWLDDITQMLNDIKLPPNLGNKDITLFSGTLPFEDHVYTYIRPDEVISFCYRNATDDEKTTCAPIADDVDKLDRKTLSKELDKVLKIGTSFNGRKDVKKKTQIVSRSVSESGVHSHIPPTLPPRLELKKGGKTTLKSGSQTRDFGHLEDLTIADFSGVLKKLRLDKFVDKFAKRQVDGQLAQELTEEMLKEDFRMGEFEILKLMKFITSGHIPK